MTNGSLEANAFVIPGGKVFVYTGILNIAKTDDMLAAILGHEIAHNLARHAAESMSRDIIITVPIRFLMFFLDSTGYTMGLGRILGDLALGFGVQRPASRQQESEADYIGLLLMAKSCYNPSAAVTVWERMGAAEKAAGQSIPEWMSTHPSSSNRMQKMQEWIPKAEETRNESGCAAMAGYLPSFGVAVGGAWT
jgi:predicted Zn-dependent protease